MDNAAQNSMLPVGLAEIGATVLFDYLHFVKAVLRILRNYVLLAPSPIEQPEVREPISILHVAFGYP